MPNDKPGLIGKEIRIKGKVRGKEDLTIEGRVEGNIALEDNHLLVERSAVLQANAQVRNITIKGELHGNTDASDKVEMSNTAKIVGDIKTPRLVITSGARFRGNVDMEVPLPAGLLDPPPTGKSKKDKDKYKAEAASEPEPVQDEAWH